jgi:hypothetical protein
MSQNNDELDRQMRAAIDQGDMTRLDELIAKANKVEARAEEVINRKEPPTPKLKPEEVKAAKEPPRPQSEFREGSAKRIFADRFREEAAKKSPKEPEVQRTGATEAELTEKLQCLLDDLKFAEEYYDKNDPMKHTIVNLTKREMTRVQAELTFFRGDTTPRYSGARGVFADYFREEEKKKKRNGGKK